MPAPRRLCALLLSLLVVLGLVGLAAPASAATLTFTPTQDTTVNSGLPTTASGTAPALRADDASPEKISYLEFDVTGVSGAVTGAQVELVTSATGPAATVELREVTGTWSETTTYNTRPALGALVDTATVPTAADQPVVFDVPITADGTYDYAVVRTTTGAENMFGSSESTNADRRPALTITTGTAPPTNAAPTVSAGADQSVTLPASASLDGTVSDDGNPAGSTVTQTWTKVSGPGTVTFGTPTAEDTTASFGAAGTYVLRLTASDTALSASDDVTVTVSPAPATNQAPVANAGPDVAVTLPNSATLDGTVTDDGLPSGSTLTTTWSKFSGPGVVTFGDASAVDTTASFSAAGSYVLRLTASDGALSDTDNVAVTVSAAPAPSGDVAFPADSGVIFLADAPYNVDCDGTTDNTAGIQAAMNDHANNSSGAPRFAFHTLVLPAGTCLVSDTLAAPGAALRIVGAGQAATTLKLANNAAGYGSAATPKYVLRPGIEGTNNNDNTAYGNYVQDFTIDVGAGNPGAVALRMAMCNSGAVERMTLRAPAGSGLRGLTVESGAGPAMGQDITIEGFAVGIWTENTVVNNIVFHNTTLKNQREVAIQQSGKSFQFEGLTVTGAPKVYQSTTGYTTAIFVDVTATGPGSGTAFDTDNATAFLHLRNVQATGWGNLVTDGGTSRFVGKTSIAEWASENYRRGNTSVAWTETSAIQSLNLAHPRVAPFSNYDLSTWRKVSGAAADDGPAIQAAIDSAGAKVVYLPYGTYTVNSAVIVRNGVERIDFMGSVVSGTGKISVGAGTAPTVWLANAAMSLDMEQNSSRTVAVENMGAVGATPGDLTTGISATGDLFLENSSGRVVTIDEPIQAFIRQLNREGRAASVSGGATVWMMGDNLEMHDDKGSPFFPITGSTLEVLGGAMDNLAGGGRFTPTTSAPLYDATGSTVSIVQPGVVEGAANTGHPISDDAIEVTSAHTLIHPGVGAYDRWILPLYVSP